MSEERWPRGLFGAMALMTDAEFDRFMVAQLWAFGIGFVGVVGFLLWVFFG